MKTLEGADAQLRQGLAELLQQEPVSEQAALEIFGALADSGANAALKAAVLTALSAKGLSAPELAAFARAMLLAARGPIPHTGKILVDTCGTGGDGSGSFNFSSACALLVAALGIPVAKHGNRSVSSRSGSADFFQALGVPFQKTASEAQGALEQEGFAFLFARDFHPAMRGLAEVRQQLGIRTLFNLLGPLVNPARPSHQLIGCTSSQIGSLLAQTAQQLDLQRAFIVCGNDGWDEATPCGPFEVFEVGKGQVRARKMNPAEFDVRRCSPEDLRAGDAEDNARLLHALFRGERGPLRSAVVLNAALVLLLVGVADSPKAAAQIAGEGIDSGAASSLLQRLTKGEPKA